MNLITHAIVGLAISQAFILNPLIVIIGATISDIDIIIGIEHRTITHSLIFLAITCLLIYKLKNKKASYSFMLGLTSHYILDSLTPMGLPLFYPLSTNYSFNLSAWNDLTTNLGLILASIIVIINKRNIHEYLESKKKKIVFNTVNILILSWIALLCLFPVIKCPGENDPINVLELMPGETMAKVTGVICSNITLTKSSSNNTYQVFTLCDETGNITVWKAEWISDNNLTKNDPVTVCGKYTRKYSKPELYYITQVTKTTQGNI